MSPVYSPSSRYCQRISRYGVAPVAACRTLPSHLAETFVTPNAGTLLPVPLVPLTARPGERPADIAASDGQQSGGVEQVVTEIV